jgi:hypothetical protein
MTSSAQLLPHARRAVIRGLLSFSPGEYLDITDPLTATSSFLLPTSTAPSISAPTDDLSDGGLEDENLTQLDYRIVTTDKELEILATAGHNGEEAW